MATSQKREEFQHQFEQIKKTLPIQGPLEVYGHRNPLHAYEDLDFEVAAQKALDELGFTSYLQLNEYRTLYENKRITPKALNQALEEWGKKFRQPLDEEIWGHTLTQKKLMHLCLRFALVFPDREGLDWYLEEGDILEKPVNPNYEASEVQLKKLWNICFKKVQGMTVENIQCKVPGPWSLDGDDKEAVDRYLISFIAPYCDQGISYWPFPNSKNLSGFKNHFIEHLLNPGVVYPHWFKGVKAKAKKYKETDSWTMAQELAELICPNPDQIKDLLSHEMFALKGWATLINQYEGNPSLATSKKIDVSLIDFMAIRLLLLAEMIAHKKHTKVIPTDYDQRFYALTLFYLAQARNMSGVDIEHISNEKINEVLVKIFQFKEIDKQQIWQRAYELTYRNKMLSALSIHQRNKKSEKEKIENTTPQFQAFFCLDDREESIRRYAEYLSSGIKTYGIPGFFGVPMRYRRIKGASAPASCPAIGKPNYYIEEVPKLESVEQHKSGIKKSSFLRKIWYSIYLNTKTTLVAYFLTIIGGLSTIIPLGLRVLMPRLSTRMWMWMKEYMNPHYLTKLKVDHTSTELFEGLQRGLTHQQMCEAVGTILQRAGLVDNFAPIIVMIGHSSSSQNNPHLAAYKCLACGGNSGGPNARAFAQMANKPAVRELLKKQGIVIPDNTHFVAGNHDTCTDSFNYYDLEDLPIKRKQHFELFSDLMKSAGELNALERVRRFAIKPLNLNPKKALVHAETRSQSIDEPRSELGHATNAMTVIGRRELTEDLFLDRRALLVSYDPTIDSNGEMLVGICGAAVPIPCMISLDYYFSRVDSTKLGTGSKLPHNVCGLFGVMNGQMSDLLTGMPWQSVELHEPMRMLIVIETTVDNINMIMDRDPQVGKMIRHRWCQLALIHPETKEITVYDDDGFVPFEPEEFHLPKVKKWEDHHMGRSENLSPAILDRKDVGHV